MTEREALNIEKLVDGLNPNDPNTIALKEAAIKRPVPAIEKPLGPRTSEHPMTEDAVYNVRGAFTSWNDDMRGRERG